MSRIPAELLEKWKFIESKRYADQCKWVLNGFWDTLQPEAERIWGWCETFSKLDGDKRADGVDLDEFWSHKFLETLGQTMTVLEMREKFRTIDADFNKRMSMIEFLIYQFKLKIVDVVNAAQGENKEEVDKAKAMVEEAQTAVEEMMRKLELSKEAAERARQTLQASNARAAEAAQAAAEADRAAKSAAKAAADAAKAAQDSAVAAKQSAEAAANAKKTAEDAKKAAEAAWFAEQENKKALEELHAQEKAYNDKRAELEAIKADQSIGVVKRNRAANELDQLLAEDPLPLRKAKINQAATVKKSEKASAAAADSKAKAEANAAAAAAAAEAAAVALANAEAAAAEASARAQEADAASQAAKEAQAAAEEAAQVAAADAEAAEEAKRAVEAAVSEAESKLQEALDFLQAAKQKGGIAHGDIWWMEREIIEKKKYMPKSKQ